MGKSETSEDQTHIPFIQTKILTLPLENHYINN